MLRVRKMHNAAMREFGTLPVPPPHIPKKDYARVLEGIRADFAVAHVASPDYLSEIVTPTPSVCLAQFDMLFILAIFFVMLDTMPEYFGLLISQSDKSRHGYESYVYYVGCIGRYLGIKDRYNIALHPSPAVRRAVSARILEHVIQDRSISRTLIFQPMPSSASRLRSPARASLRSPISSSTTHLA